ncbi:MAG TPA: TRAP transporter large permease [Spirochaetia bacterium]|nr:TRAP transporter large permease [Spirochaetales bacterium]HRZ89803.1 TRAP transporter large permease [Spirochaetia bacterium]
MTTTLFLSFAVLILLNVPIAFSLFISASLALALNGITLMAVIQRGVTAVDSFILLAIPFFMLAGNLMSGGGISNRIIKFANSSVGFIRGGLAHVNIATSMLFAGITGAAVADTSAVGSVLIPAMKDEGYDADFSAAVTASSSVIGVIIPPSIPFVIYGVITGTSIGRLFLGGIVPGILIGLVQMVISYFICAKRGMGSPKRFSIRDFLGSLRRGILALFMPVIILGGIIFGIVTPTEAAVLAIVYALFVSMVVYRELKPRDLPKLIYESGITTAIVMFMIAGAFLYSWIITNDQIPQKLAALIGMLTQDKNVVLLLFVVVYLVAGMFIDLGAAMILLVPVLYPVTRMMGIDPILFGIVTVIALAIGLVTPPVGACLFIASEIGGISILKTARSAIPYLLGILLVLLAIILYPPLALFIPGLM